MSDRATAKSVERAYIMWLAAASNAGFHVSGVKLEHESGYWRVLCADDTNTVPVGDWRGFLGTSTREARESLRRATSLLSLFPRATPDNPPADAVVLFNEYELAALQRLTAAQLREHPTNPIRVPVAHLDAGTVIEYRERLYSLQTNPLHNMASASKHTPVEVVLYDKRVGKIVYVRMNRTHTVKAYPPEHVRE